MICGILLAVPRIRRLTKRDARSDLGTTSKTRTGVDVATYPRGVTHTLPAPSSEHRVTLKTGKLPPFAPPVKSNFRNEFRVIT